ncbi:MAG: BrnA antitoxin family protein [Microvirga sp.]
MDGRPARRVLPADQQAADASPRSDVVAWFKRQGGGHQTRINRALREYAGKAQREARGK